MNPALVAALIAQIGVPELVKWLHEHFAATGQLPTNDEMIAKLGVDADEGISIGDAWLADHAPATQ